jgi:hypothetical protein
MNRYWFKSYKYGFGWYPASWQGWIVILIYGLNIYFGIHFFGEHISGKINTLIAYLPVLILTTVMLFIIVVKTGEKARWRWGNKSGDSESSGENKREMKI